MIPKAKYRFHAAAILFYIVQKKITLMKVAEILMTNYLASFQDPILSVNSISQVYASST
jgi:hypothetical protein